MQAMDSRANTFVWTSYLVTLVFGTLLHFTYDFSGRTFVSAPFSAVNESVWEHLKLVFWPPVIFLVVEYPRFGRGQANYWLARGAGVAVSVVTIPAVFYGYSVPLGRSILFIDIATFVLAASLGAWTAKALISRPSLGRGLRTVGLATIAVGIVCFTAFTFNPPQLGIFKDGNTGTYGRLTDSLQGRDRLREETRFMSTDSRLVRTADQQDARLTGK